MTSHPNCPLLFVKPFSCQSSWGFFIKFTTAVSSSYHRNVYKCLISTGLGMPRPPNGKSFGLLSYCCTDVASQTPNRYDKERVFCGNPHERSPDSLGPWESYGAVRTQLKTTQTENERDLPPRAVDIYPSWIIEE